MTKSVNQIRLEETTASLLNYSKWLFILMFLLILYAAYAFNQSRIVEESEQFLVDDVFVTKAGRMDRVGISAKGQRYYLISEFPLSAGEDLLLERRGNAELYVCMLNRYRCSEIRRL